MDKGISELRVDHGPGYRLYFIQKGRVLIILLCGGDKRTQTRDIETARTMARQLQDTPMARKTKPWDVVDHFKTEEDRIRYLEACFEENDPALIAAALGDVARARGMSGLARKTGLTREGLNKALSPDGNPSLATILKVSQALGLKLRIAVS